MVVRHRSGRSFGDPHTDTRPATFQGVDSGLSYGRPPGARARIYGSRLILSVTEDFRARRSKRAAASRPRGGASVAKRHRSRAIGPGWCDVGRVRRGCAIRPPRPGRCAGDGLAAESEALDDWAEQAGGLGGQGEGLGDDDEIGTPFDAGNNQGLTLERYQQTARGPRQGGCGAGNGTQLPLVLPLLSATRGEASGETARREPMMVSGGWRYCTPAWNVLNPCGMFGRDGISMVVPAQTAPATAWNEHPSPGVLSPGPR